MPAPDVDFGTAAKDYAEHRRGFPDSFFERLARLGWGTPGHTVVDLGTGTGSLARGFASRGCRTIGVDASEKILVAAREMAGTAGVEIEFVEASAESTGLPSESADLVTAGQCWHWFDRDAAAAEATRILKPEGCLVIAHFDWVPVEGNVADVTERLIQKHNPKWNLGGGMGVHPWWLPGLTEAGYIDIESFSYDVDPGYTHESWRGRVRASAGIGPSLPPAEVERFDEELARVLDRHFPGDPLPVLHRVFAILARPPR